MGALRMFFGKKEPEQVSQDALEALLVRLFEGRLGQLSERSEAILRKAEEAREEFVGACDALEGLDVQPYTEDLYAANVTSLRSQKSIYSKTVKRMMEDMDLVSGGGATTYDRYAKVLGRMDGTVSEILKANASFRLVMYSYSNHLGAFKRSFAGIERAREELRHEIRARARSAEEYAGVRDEIGRLASLVEELGILGNNAETLRHDAGSRDRETIAADERETRTKLEARRRELEGANAAASKASEEISLLTTPLERASRKHDHLSMSKVGLSAIISDPIGRIGSIEDYEAFVGAVKEMAGNVSKGSIETKNSEGLMRSVDALLESDLYGKIEALRKLQFRKAVIAEETRVLERTLADLGKGRKGMEKANTDAAEMERRKDTVSAEIESSRRRIEEMFGRYYHMRIRVT